MDLNLGSEKTTEKSNKEGSGIYCAFLKTCLLCRTSNMSRDHVQSIGSSSHKITWPQVHGPGLNTDAIAIIDLKSERVQGVQLKTLSLRDSWIFQRDPVSFACTAIWVPCHVVGCTRVHWNLMRSMCQLLPAKSENEGLLHVNFLVIPLYFFRQV